MGCTEKSLGLAAYWLLPAISEGARKLRPAVLNPENGRLLNNWLYPPETVAFSIR